MDPTHNLKVLLSGSNTHIAGSIEQKGLHICSNRQEALRYGSNKQFRMHEHDILYIYTYCTLSICQNENVDPSQVMTEGLKFLLFSTQSWTGQLVFVIFEFSETRIDTQGSDTQGS